MENTEAQQVVEDFETLRQLRPITREACQVFMNRWPKLFVAPVGEDRIVLGWGETTKDPAYPPYASALVFAADYAFSHPSSGGWNIRKNRKSEGRLFDLWDMVQDLQALLIERQHES